MLLLSNSTRGRGPRLHWRADSKRNPHGGPVYTAIRRLPSIPQSLRQRRLFSRDLCTSLTSWRLLALWHHALHVLQPRLQIYEVLIDMQRPQLRLPRLCNGLVSHPRRSAGRKLGCLLPRTDQGHESVAVAGLVEFVGAAAGEESCGLRGVDVVCLAEEAGKVGVCVGGAVLGEQEWMGDGGVGL